MNVCLMLNTWQIVTNTSSTDVTAFCSFVLAGANTVQHLQCKLESLQYIKASVCNYFDTQTSIVPQQSFKLT